MYWKNTPRREGCNVSNDEVQQAPRKRAGVRASTARSPVRCGDVYVCGCFYKRPCALRSFATFASYGS